MDQTRLGLNAGDLDAGVLLAMTLLFAVGLAAFHFEDDHLFALEAFDDLARDFGTGNQGSAYFAVVFAGLDKQDLVGFKVTAFFDVQQVYVNDGIFCHLVLLAAADDDCVHGWKTQKNSPAVAGERILLRLLK